MLYDVSVYKQYIYCLKISKLHWGWDAFSVKMAAILNVDFRPLKPKFEFANIDIRI